MVKDDSNFSTTGGSEQRVAETLQALRERAGLSLRTLATRAGFSASFISQIEHGQASPSISSLEKIAAALGVTLSEFFAQEPGTPGGAVIVRASERPQITSDWSKATLEALGPLNGGVEPVILTLAPGGRSGSRPAAHHGEEFALVFAGEVQFSLGETVHQLSQGDAVTFSSQTPHSWENSGPKPASILIVSNRPR